MAGNKLGSKSNYIYQTDIPDLVYVLQRDDDLVFAGLGAGAGAPAQFDPASPPAGKTVSLPPRRFEPRVLFIEDTADGARKDLICFDPTADLYVTQQRTAIPAIDGVNTFISTGRKGEKLSF